MALHITDGGGTRDDLGHSTFGVTALDLIPERDVIRIQTAELFSRQAEIVLHDNGNSWVYGPSQRKRAYRGVPIVVTRHRIAPVVPDLVYRRIFAGALRQEPVARAKMGRCEERP